MLARRLARAYGTDALKILEGRCSLADLGKDFGHGIYAAELNWAMAHEWVMIANDFIWRRTKLGLVLSPKEVEQIAAYIAAYHSQD